MSVRTETSDGDSRVHPLPETRTTYGANDRDIEELFLPAGGIALLYRTGTRFCVRVSGGVLAFHSFLLMTMLNASSRWQGPNVSYLACVAV